MLIFRTPHEESSTIFCVIVCHFDLIKCARHGLNARVTFRLKLVCESAYSAYFRLIFGVVRMSFVSVSYYMCALS